jgi:flagellar protein FliO/FliZ
LVSLLDWGRALFALIATLALIGLVAYGARRLGMIQPGQAGVRRLKVLESLMLDPRRRLVVVRFDNRDHLLLLSPAGDRPIAEVAAKEMLETGEART